MKTLLLSGMCAVGLLALSESASAHGGQYVGPGDVVPPPSPGGGRTGQPGRPTNPTTGGQPNPGAPAPAGGSTPGTTGGPPQPVGGSGARATSTPRGVVLVDDLTTWEFWWELNKNPYLRLKEHVHTDTVQTGSLEFFLGHNRREAVDHIKPATEEIRDKILPALKGALDNTLERDFDIISSCMVALAKIGQDHRDFRLVDVFEQRLAASNQEIRETAALSLGIAGMTATPERQLDLLTGLALDNALGRRASGRRDVDGRTRAFALYGLGLAAHSTANMATKARALDAFEQILAAHEQHGRNLVVAAIHGVSLLNIGRDPGAASDLQARSIRTLEAFYALPLGAGRRMLQSHVPTAIAKIIGYDHPDVERWKDRFAADLQTADKKRRNHDISRSCALALGQLCRPGQDDKSVDGRCSKALLQTWRDHKDAQTRYFAVMALGQIGGEQNRTRLLRALPKARTLDKSWCALALGIYAHDLRAASAGNPSRKDADDALIRTIGILLHDEFRQARRPGLIAALGVALGLCQHADAAPDLRQQLVENKQKESMAGYMCIGLALMRDVDSKKTIHQVVVDSVRQPKLLQQAAVALGVLGDKEAAQTLHHLLQDTDGNLAKLASISTALGFIGDRRSIEPLVGMLGNQDLGQLSRAFAAVALGGVADKEMLPWNSKIAINTNYRANTETLTNQASGILDIL